MSRNGGLEKNSERVYGFTDVPEGETRPMSPDTESALPAEVVEAIHANRKIEAIKLLRDSRKLGLREAKEAVEGYIAERNPPMAPRRRVTTITGLGSLIWLGMGLLAAYAAYRLLSSG